MTDINGVRSEDETAVPGRQGSGLRMADVFEGGCVSVDRATIRYWEKDPDGPEWIVEFLHEECAQAAGVAINCHDELVEAVEALLHAVCSETGFAQAVRKDTGLAYPWEGLEIAEGKARATLAKATNQS